MPLVSVVMPVLNEAETLGSSLGRLMPLIGDEHELIVVDGGSVDETVAIAGQFTPHVVRSASGRARQMNAGAERAGGVHLLFLHADTELPSDAFGAVAEALQTAQWGRFDLRLSGSHRAFRIIERMISWRSRCSGIATGDQAIFVRSCVFRALGGFAELPLMEDVELSKRLRKRGWPSCLRKTVRTSSRRWETGGIVRTVVLMWTLRALFALGVPPERLVRYYRNHGASTAALDEDRPR